MPHHTIICFDRSMTPQLEYGAHQNEVSKICLIPFQPPSECSFGMELTNYQKDGKMLYLQLGNTLSNTIVHAFLFKQSNFEKQNRMNIVKLEI